jgi:hypothetical protein
MSATTDDLRKEDGSLPDLEAKSRRRMWWKGLICG